MWCPTSGRLTSGRCIEGRGTRGTHTRMSIGSTARPLSGWVSLSIPSQTPHDLWSMLPRPVVDKWINDEISTPEAVATECLRGPLRILVPSMLEVLPIVWECTTCGQRAFKPKAGCSSVARPYDLPERKRVVFVDDDLIVHVPPPGSTVWLRLEQLQRGGGSSQAQAQEPEPVQESERTAPSLPPQAEPTPRPHTPETLQAPSSPPQFASRDAPMGAPRRHSRASAGCTDQSAPATRALSSG